MEANSTTIAGDVRGPVFSGVFYGPVFCQIIQQRYPLLKDYVYDVAATIEGVTQGFVGRDFVFAWLEDHLHTLPCGYLRLVADAGLGKTALAAEIARRYGALVHFVNASAGITSPGQCLNHLAASLIARYDLPYDHLPERAGQDANFLQTVLQAAAEKRGDPPLLVVIDALDEADPVAAERNWLLLPASLPRGVYVLLTHRPGNYPLATAAQTPQPEPLVIAWDDPRQQGDIAAHLQRQAARPEICRALAGAAPPIAVAQFVSTLQAAAEGNFKYLDYVLADIAAREPGFDPLDLQGLPQGLRGYYDHFWAQMEQVKGQEGWAEWKGLYRPVIELLGVAGEPVPAVWLANHTGRDADEIEERALQRWRRFLRCERQATGPRTWRIVHRSFADFLAEKVTLPAAHRRVAEYYLAAWGGWEAGLPNLSTAADKHGGYGLRHLAAHLHSAAWWEPLRTLFASDAWLHARVPADGYTYDGYLADLELAWRRAEAEARQQIAGGAPPDALADGVRYALIRSTVNSLASNYAPELVTRAVETGLWPAARALSVAAKIPEVKQRAKVYTLLLSLEVLTPAERQAAQAGGLAAARATGDEADRAQALVALAPRLTGELLTAGLALALEIGNEGRRTQVLVALAPQLTGELLVKGLVAAQAIRYGRYRAQVLAALAPPLRGDWLEKGLEVARSLQDDWARSKALMALASPLEAETQEHALLPVLVGAKRESLLAESLAAAQAIRDPYDRAMRLAALADQLRGAAHEQVLAEGIQAARVICWPEARAEALAVWAPRLTETERETWLAQELEIASGIENEKERTRVLMALSPRLSGARLATGLAVARSIQNEWQRAQALAALAPQLSGEVLAEGLAVARAIEDPQLRTYALAALAPRLNAAERADVLQAGLAAVSAIKNDTARTWALAVLAAQLTGDLLAGQLAVAQAIGDEQDCGPALAALERARVIKPAGPRKVGRPRRWGAKARERALAKELARARSAIETLKAQILVALAPQLEGAALTEALAIVPAIEEEWRQARVLAALAPQLTGDALATGLTLARAIQGEDARARALAALLRSGSGPQAQAARREYQEFVCVALRAAEQRHRAAVLRFLADNAFCPAALGLTPAAVERLATAVAEICQRWEWL